MPAEAKWFHVVFNTKNSWLPGDLRGFRARDHRIHSGGDYKNPPPASENIGLRIHHTSAAESVVQIARRDRPAVLASVLRFLKERELQCIAISVGATHVHLLVKSTDGYDGTRAFVGKLKNIVSYELRSRMPGSIWSRGCCVKPIRDRAHQLRVFGYIVKEQEPGAIAWSILDSKREQSAANAAASAADCDRKPNARAAQDNA